jgi:hypothetical protein
MQHPARARPALTVANTIHDQLNITIQTAPVTQETERFSATCAGWSLHMLLTCTLRTTTTPYILMINTLQTPTTMDSLSGGTDVYLKLQKNIRTMTFKGRVFRRQRRRQCQ